MDRIDDTIDTRERAAGDAADAARAPLTYPQEQLWFLDQFEPGNIAYVTPLVIRITGLLDVPALRCALETIMRRHDALRTAFNDDAGVPYQWVAPAVAVDLPCDDLSDLPASQKEFRVDEILSRRMREAFDLTQPPLVRFRLIRLGESSHLLVAALHHIIADGWSVSVLITELSRLYDALSKGEPSPLQPLSVQFPQYALAQRHRTANPDTDRLLTYWKGQLSGAPLVLDLPTDRPRPPVQTFEGRRLSRPLPAQLASDLTRVSRASRVSLYMTLLGAYGLLLHRYSGPTDLVIGTPIANRTSVETEGMIGNFVNTLALRLNLDGDPSFGELLMRVRDVTLGALAHQEMPLESLVRELLPQRDPSRSPLFQVSFALQNVPRQSSAAGAVHFERQRIGNGTAKFDLTFEVVPEQTGLILWAEYRTDLFNACTIERMMEQYEALLISAASEPQTPVSRLSMLTPLDHRTLENEARKDCETPVEARCLHELFESQVRETPSAPAVTTPQQTLTFEQLNARANRLAHHLKAKGVERGSIVAIVLNRSADLISALLAALKAGAAFLIIEADAPPQRLHSMLKQAKPYAIITQSAHRVSTARFDCPAVILDDDAEQAAIGACSDANPPLFASPQDLAYVVFTSGSTGRPKGVAVEHRQVTQYVGAVADTIGLRGPLNYAMLSTLAADLGHTAMFPSLCFGGCLHIMPREQSFDPEAVAAYTRRHLIDCIKITPSHLASLLEGSDPAAVLPRRFLVLGGESVRRSFVERVRTLAPNCAIYNHYGPSETTIGAVAGLIEPDDNAPASEIVPLGWPLRHARAYALDSHGQPVPVGVSGELYIGGAGVARGYLGDDEATRKRFTPDPFRADDPTARVYRTGDRVRRLTDGTLQFMGRLDRQVKIRGHRVEPAEIEAALREHPDVRDAAVHLFNDDQDQPQLAAYVVPNHVTPAGFANHKTMRLPNGMVVAHLNRNETNYIYREIFELQAYLRHGISIRDGDTVVDVGANIGLFSLFVRQIAPHASVYSFEPNPAVFNILRANAAAHAPGAEVYQLGLADRQGSARFTFFEGFSLLSGLYADAETERAVVKSFIANQQRDGSAEMAALAQQADDMLAERFASSELDIPLKTLSAFLRDKALNTIDLLKINVEKSELSVLRGIAHEDWRRIRQIVLEVDLDEHFEPITTLLNEHGFEWVMDQDVLLDGTALRYLYAIRPGDDRRLVREKSRNVAATVPHVTSNPLSFHEVRSHLAQRLPPAMMPAALMLIESIPLMGNGKTDFAALPAPDRQRTSHQVPFTMPQTPIERKLAAIWSRLLGVEHVGLSDDFFELGGHSLKAVTLAIAIQQEFGKQLALREIFEHSTLMQMARRLSTDQESMCRPAAPLSGRSALTRARRQQVEQMTDSQVMAMLSLRRSSDAPAQPAPDASTEDLV